MAGLNANGLVIGVVEFQIVQGTQPLDHGRVILRVTQTLQRKHAVHHARQDRPEAPGLLEPLDDPLLGHLSNRIDFRFE